MIEKHDFGDHSVFVYDGESALTLYLFDDHWHLASRFFDEVNPQVPGEAEKWVTSHNRLGIDPENILAVCLLPQYAATFAGIKKLYISGISDELPAFVHEAFGNELPAFLFDIYDYSLRESLGNLMLEKVLSRGVPASRCAYYTFGAGPGRPLEFIVKGSVYRERGLLLRDWWERVQGKIDADLLKEFDEHGDIRKGGRLEYLAIKDKYGVLLACSSEDSESPPNERLLEYRYAQCFFNSGSNFSEESSGEVPFGALWSFARGIARSVHRYGSAIFHDGSSVSGGALEDLMMIRFTTDAKTFESTAMILRRFAHLVTFGSEGSVYVHDVAIAIGDTRRLRITFGFRGDLPLVWREGTLVPGLLCDCWDELVCCFGGSNPPAFDFKDKSLNLHAEFLGLDF